MDPVIFGVITASDRASSGDYEDLSGPAIAEFLSMAISNPYTVERRIIPDEREIIEKTMIELCNAGCSVIVTTGGTGPAPRGCRRSARRRRAPSRTPAMHRGDLGEI